MDAEIRNEFSKAVAAAFKDDKDDENRICRASLCSISLLECPVCGAHFRLRSIRNLINCPSCGIELEIE